MRPAALTTPTPKGRFRSLTTPARESRSDSEEPGARRAVGRWSAGSVLERCIGEGEVGI